MTTVYIVSRFKEYGEEEVLTEVYATRDAALAAHPQVYKESRNPDTGLAYLRCVLEKSGAAVKSWIQIDEHEVIGG